MENEVNDNMFEKKKPNVFLFLKHENQQLILAVTIACIIACIIFSSKMHFMIIGYAVFMYYRFSILQQRLTRYSLKDKNKTYFLFSKLLLDDPDTNVNYLENFIKDYRYADWDNTTLIEQYHAIYQEIDVDDFPNYYSFGKQKNYYNDFVNLYQESLLSKLGSADLESNLFSLWMLFSEVSMDKSYSSAMMSIGKAQDILDSRFDSNDQEIPKPKNNTKTTKSSTTNSSNSSSNDSYSKKESNISTYARLEYENESLGSNRYRVYCGNCDKDMGARVITYSNHSHKEGTGTRICVYCNARNTVEI